MQISENESFNAALVQGVLPQNQPNQPEHRYYFTPEGYKGQKELHSFADVFVLSLDKAEGTLTGHHHMI